jgi:hypothetical protein
MIERLFENAPTARGGGASPLPHPTTHQSTVWVAGWGSGLAPSEIGSTANFQTDSAPPPLVERG